MLNSKNNHIEHYLNKKEYQRNLSTKIQFHAHPSSILCFWKSFKFRWQPSTMYFSNTSIFSSTYCSISWKISRILFRLSSNQIKWYLYLVNYHSSLVNVNMVIMETKEACVYQTKEMVTHRSPITKMEAFLQINNKWILVLMSDH